MAAVPTGPLSGPSPTTWRRERLLRIGSSPALPVEGQFTRRQDSDVSVNNAQFSTDASETVLVDEATTLQADNVTSQSPSSYGTLPSPRRRLFTKPSITFRSRHNFPVLPGLQLPRRSSASNPTSPLNINSSASFRDLSYFRVGTQRPISAYDAPYSNTKPGASEDLDAKTNGIRVWYSSFSSIDWLHDAIKDRVRFSRLRKRKSIRAQIRLAVDKSIGWFVVTIIGFLTAVIAFLVVRSEQWLFDSKEGYCRMGWWKAKRFCCPSPDDDGFFIVPGPFAVGSTQPCPAWRPWAEVLGATTNRDGKLVIEQEFVQYMAYAFVAVSCFLLPT
jgi:chloride channel 3/4/5